MTTLDLPTALVARLAGGDGAAGLTVSAAPVQLSIGQLLLVILALAVVASLVGGLAAIAWERVHDPRNTESDGP